jgi:hypothetical protein
MRRKFWGS